MLFYIHDVCSMFVNKCSKSLDLKFFNLHVCSLWKMSKLCKWDNSWHHTLDQIYYIKYIKRADSVNLQQKPCNTSCTPVKIIFPWQPSLFQSPVTWFQHFSDFEFENQMRSNINWGHVLDQTYLYFFWIIQIRPLATINMVARNTFNIEEVWNPVCCHGYKNINLILWRTSSRILMQRIKHFCKLAEISLLSYLIKIKLSVWCHHLTNLHI